MNPARFSIANRAFVNAVFVLVIAVGVYSVMTVPRELNPQVGFNWAFVTTIWMGASPEEVEELITVEIEDELRTVEDVDVITSRSRTGRSFVWVKFEQIGETRFEQRLDDVRARVTGLDLPAAADPPIVEAFSSYDFQPVATVAVYGDASERQLHVVARRMKDLLGGIDGVATVEAFGDRDRAVLVEIDPVLLEAHRLDPADVETSLARANLNLPAGVLELGGQEYVVRTRSRFQGAAEVERVALRASDDGRRVLVRDVATVTDGFVDRTTESRFDGQSAVTLALTKNEHGNTLEIVREARRLVAQERANLPGGVALAVANDESLLVDIILGVLESNALLGLVLVVLALLVFIGWRSAVCAALGIPVTFLLAITALDWSGSSLNGNTLFGLILVLGMVVDDAIVILENSYRHLQHGKSVADAVVDGVREVAAPVVTSTFTTIAAFLPLVLMTGTIGKFMRIIPITVTLVLLASLIEALFILPSHFVDVVRLKADHRRGRSRLDGWRDRYARLLERLLRWRYAVVPAAVLALVASIALIPLIGVDLFASDEFSTIQIQITMPDGTRLDETSRVVALFEDAARGLPSEEVDAVIGNVGLLQGTSEWVHSAHVGQIWVDVVEAPDRDRSVEDIVADLRRRSEDIPGPVQLGFRMVESGPPSDAPIELLVKGPELETIDVAAQALQRELRRMPMLRDVRDDLDLRQPQIDVVVDREAAARHGLDPARVGASLRAAFSGAAATTFREGDEEVDVIVRLPEASRRAAADVARLRFVDPTGRLVPLTTVARVVEGTGPLVIRRHDRERSVTVRADTVEGADLASAAGDAQTAWDRLQPLFPDVRLEEGGQFREFWEAFEDLAKLFALGLLLNFMLMAGQFKNWVQPLVIMTVVPLSFIGAMAGLMVAAAPFSITTLYGFVALAGVAVNDSIVLVDFVNQARASGVPARESLIEAGRLRLRPIMLTTITTVFGLLPMALGLGGESETWQPLATTIAAGLTVATAICLFVLPCLQAIVDDVTGLSGRQQSSIPSRTPLPAA